MEKLKFEVHICEHCNLNCKGCYHFSPIAQKEFLDVNEWEMHCKRLSELFEGEMEFISLMGGEPLLHPKICDLLKITRKYFGIGDVSIITNGILLLDMDENFWETCRENNITIRQTKYPIDIDFNAIEKKAEKENVNFIYFNTGIKTLGYQPFDLKASQPALENFRNCYRVNSCISFSHGKLYTCFVPAHIHHLKKYFNLDIETKESDGIDIYKVNSAEEIRKLLEKPLFFCRYCMRNLAKRDGIEWETSKKDIKEWVEKI